MKVTVKYFASIREAIGQGSELRDTAATTLGALRDELLAATPAHGPAGQAIAHGDMVQFIPFSALMA